MNEPRQDRNSQDRNERIAAACEKLRKAMGRLVVIQVTDHPPTSASEEAKYRSSKESASGPGGDEGPEAGAEEDGAETEGRGTSTGQSWPGGQFVLNQQTTESYLRTVKVLPSSIRSKNRP
jgi:hypothetical protein